MLSWSLAGTVLFVVFELFAGIRAGSLALLSDAGHNFTDALALGLAAFGFYLQHKPADDVKTYGYHRAGVLAAFVNALTLVILSGFIFYESAARLRKPEPVQETVMMAVAGLGLLLNGAIMAAQAVFARHELVLFDVEELSTHGGSIRIYARHLADKSRKVSASANAMLERERALGFDKLDTYAGFGRKVVGLKHALLRLLSQHVASVSFTYSHHWQPGDLVAWDEVHALHRAPDNFAPHERKVVRVTAGRAVPKAAFS